MIYTRIEVANILGNSGLLQSGLTPKMLEAVETLYNDPKRRYHDWNHALGVLSWINYVATIWGEKDLAPYNIRDLRFAALFHDVIYNASQKPPVNEEASAAYLLSLGIPDTDQAADIIRVTAKHGKLEANEVPRAFALFLDCDIASFGEARWDLVLANESAIKFEYEQHYTVEEVRAGRKVFLEGMLKKKSIFLHQHFRTRFEEQAQHNIQRILSETL